MESVLAPSCPTKLAVTTRPLTVTLTGYANVGVSVLTRVATYTWVEDTDVPLAFTARTANIADDAASSGRTAVPVPATVLKSMAWVAPVATWYPVTALTPG